MSRRKSKTTKHGSRRHILSAGARKHDGRRALRCELLEDRRVLATFFVTNSAASGAGSLAQAVADANADAATDDIVFDAGLAPIVLGGELLITESVNIAGNGNTVDGGGVGRVFNLNDGDGYANKAISIDGLTITGGDARNDPQATGSENGGGIRNLELLTVTNSTITGNFASGGAGIANFGGAYLSDSTISDNGAVYSGAGLLNTNLATATNVDFTGNSVGVGAGASYSVFGGGFLNSGGNLTISGGSVMGNDATHPDPVGRSGLGGGGASTGAAVTTLENTTISGNTSTDFGGGFSATAGAFELTMTNVDVKDNSAGVTGGAGRGGGMYLSGQMVADGYGGFTRDVPQVTITGGTISGNVAQNGPFADATVGLGGGMLLGVNVAATITDAVITGNTAFSDGAGIWLSNFGTPTSQGAYSQVNIVRGEISDNLLPFGLDAAGNALFPYGAGTSQQVQVHLTLTGTTVSGNVAGDGTNAGNSRGGGVFASAFSDGTDGRYSRVTLVDAVVSGNQINEPNAFGAGLQFSQRAEGFVYGSTFTGNYSASQGGGIGVLFGSRVTVADTTFDGNSAAGDGGAIRPSVGNAGTFPVSELTVRGSTFVNNTSGFDGGAISAATTILDVENSTFTGNVAANDGGAIWDSSGSAAANSTYASTSIRFSTISGNEAQDSINATPYYSGGGISTYGTLATIENSIVSGNIAPAGAPDLDDFNGYSTVRYSLISDPTDNMVTNGIDGNIVGTAALLGALANNGGPTQTMALLAGSAGIGAADPAATQAVDQRGFARPGTDGLRDMGAYETDGAAVGEPCDFDGDGDCDIVDIDDLIVQIASGSTDLTYDLDGDLAVGLGDRDTWLAQAGALNLDSGSAYAVGDANLSGAVDVSDFNLWSNNKFTANSGWSSGDFNADGFVDVSDFNLWSNNKFTFQGTPVALSAAAGLNGTMGADRLRDAAFGEGRERTLAKNEVQPHRLHATEQAETGGQRRVDGVARIMRPAAGQASVRVPLTPVAVAKATGAVPRDAAVFGTSVMQSSAASSKFAAQRERVRAQLQDRLQAVEEKASAAADQVFSSWNGLLG